MSTRPSVLLALMLISSVVSAIDADAIVVRFQFSTNGVPFAPVDVRLFQTAMPNSVDNFLLYEADDSWSGTFLHRRSFLSDSGVEVLQGGGFSIPETGMIGNVGGQSFLDLDPVPSKGNIDDEPGGGVQGISNLRGTIANAKAGPNTANSQWYFNLIDNTNLDDPNASSGGFSAFGRVLGNGMDVIDAISSLTVVNVGVQPVTNVPIFDFDRINAQGNVFNADVVLVDSVELLDIPAGDYNLDGVVDAADYVVWRDQLGSERQGEADGNGNGVVDMADYFVWRNSFGQRAAVGAAIAVASVPEPAAAALFAILVACGALAKLNR